MLKLRDRRAGLRVAAVVPVVVLALAACGGSSSTSSAAPSSAPNPSATGTPGQGGQGFGGGMGGVDFQAIQACLKAAGVSLPTPSGRPSGMPSGMPSGVPSNRPTDMPRPSGTGGFRNGGGGGMFQSKEVQAALKACGITVPTGRPSASATAAG